MGKTNLGAIDVLKHTDRSNCGECGLANCMAFAALAARGQKDARDCPKLGDEIVAQLSGAGSSEEAEAPEDRRKDLLEELMPKVAALDFDDTAARLGGEVVEGRLSFRCFGKFFEIGRDGRLHSECHVNPWVHGPLLAYVLGAKGADPVGEWVTYREIEESHSWVNFFDWRVERLLHKMMVEHDDLFLDVLDLFGEELGEAVPSADHCIVMHPLPKVPMLVAYWKTDGAFESKLTVFFDQTINQNMSAQSTYYLGQGIVEMFERIIERHRQESSGVLSEELRRIIEGRR